MTISQKELTGGLSFAADWLASHMIGWSFAEGSGGVLPTYIVHDIEGGEELAAELVETGRWEEVNHKGSAVAYVITPNRDRREEVIVEVRASELARNLVEEAQADADEPDANHDQGINEDSRRIIDAAPRHDPKPANSVIKGWSLSQFTDEVLDDAFDEFREEFPGDPPNSDELFDTFIEAVRATKSISKVTAAASQYDGRVSAQRWLQKELYLDEEAFHHKA